MIEANKGRAKQPGFCAIGRTRSEDKSIQAYNPSCFRKLRHVLYLRLPAARRTQSRFASSCEEIPPARSARYLLPPVTFRRHAALSRVDSSLATTAGASGAFTRSVRCVL